jgi:hypothetical protein
MVIVQHEKNSLQSSYNKHRSVFYEKKQVGPADVPDGARDTGF